jgi:hypothetical protein
VYKEVLTGNESFYPELLSYAPPSDKAKAYLTTLALRKDEGIEDGEWKREDCVKLVRLYH